MMKLKYLPYCLIAIFLFNCKEEKNETKTPQYVIDNHSYANPNEAVITHLNLDLEVNFSTEKIKGIATYNIKNNKAKQIILDSKYLDIYNVLADGNSTSFKLGEFNEQLGQPLYIAITENTKQITVLYETTNQTEALQWLNPQQTADKANPFLFTQGQAILTRTWIPIQDSPQIRITYAATVKTPNNLMAVMSAENPKEKNKNGVYTFNMQQTIPPYLIALAVGDLGYKPISNRTGVYAEKLILDKASIEFSDMDKMVQAAENLYGPYAWQQFDVLVLPPSFPFGGMENPRLTFATPTILAGDKSLTSLIAHELAHSWSGNLVTNATWDDFWLNEGFTVYFEMRIMEALYGKDRANMLAKISRQDLSEELENLKNNADDTHLKLNLKDRNPDDGMNSIAYDKGYLFLRTLEETVGREKMDNFLKNYFKTHAFTSMTTEKFISYLNKNLLEKENISFNTNQWVYQAGIPKNEANIQSNAFNQVKHSYVAIAKAFDKATAQIPESKNWTNTQWQDYILKETNIKKFSTWTPQEWVYFITNLPDTLTTKYMYELDQAFQFTNASNSYINMVWFDQAIRNNYHKNQIDNKIENFLMHVGRRWYVTTIFKSYKASNRLDEALKIYKKARPNYHSVTANTIDDLLDYKPN